MSSKKYAFKANAVKEKPWKYKAYPQKDVEKLAARFKARWLQVKDEEKITQTEFADKIGVTQPALNQFLNGATPISNAQIISLCRELNVSPNEMVKGIKFFEPFFSHMLVPRTIKIRMVLAATKAQALKKEKTLMETAVNFYSALPNDIDVYACLVEGDVYEPRYKHGEKVIVSAETPQPGEECLVVLEEGSKCITTLKEDGLGFICSKRATCIGCSPLKGIDDPRISYVHKVIGMTR